IELPESADEQRTQMINNAQAKSDAYTVLGLDVVWTAEFAANQWVVALPEDKFPLDDLIPATVVTGTYFDKLYGVPFTTNAELLFSRTDLLEQAGLDGPPETFEELYSAIETLQEEDPDLLGFGAQYSKYEGLTVQAAGAGGPARGRRGAVSPDRGAAGGGSRPGRPPGAVPGGRGAGRPGRRGSWRRPAGSSSTTRASPTPTPRRRSPASRPSVTASTRGSSRRRR